MNSSKKQAFTNALIREALDEGLSLRDFRKRWLILFTLCGSLLIVMLANSALNIALPSIAVDTGATSGELNWVVEAYSLVFAGCLFTAGAVGDRVGRKRVMQLGLVVFVLASAYAGFVASTAVELIVARGFMGVGAAMVMPTTLSILNVTFPASQRTKAVAIWGAVAGAGVVAGSVVSGFLIEHFEWQSVFILCVTVGVVVFITNQILTRESSDTEHTKIDWLGGVLSFLGLTALVYGLMETAHPENGAGIVIVALTLGVIFLGVFTLWQLKTDHPMLDVRLFRNRRFTVAVVVLIVTYFAMNGSLFVIGQLMQLVLGYSPLESAVALLPMILPTIVSVPFIPKFVHWFGEKITVLFGLVIMGAGLGVAVFTWSNPVDYWSVWWSFTFVLIGMLFTSTPATNMILDNVPKNRSGMGAAMNDTTRELGAAAGVAVVGSVMIGQYNTDVAEKVRSLTQLPAESIENLKESLAYALETIKQLIAHGLNIPGLAEEFKDFWMNALVSSFQTGLWVIGGTVVLVVLVLPWKKNDPTLIPEETNIS